MPTTKLRLTPLYNSYPTPYPSLGRGFCRATYRAPCGAWQASFASRGRGVADFVPSLRWGVGKLSVTPRSRRRRGSLATHICHSEGGHTPDRGSLAVGSAAVFSEMSLSTKNEILTSRAQHAPQNDRVDLSSSHIVHNQILTSQSTTAPQNDRTSSFVFPNRILDLRSSSFASRQKK